MSYFGFPRDENGNVVVADSDVVEYLESLLQQIKLLNLRFEETFGTGIDIEDIE